MYYVMYVSMFSQNFLTTVDHQLVSLPVLFCEAVQIRSSPIFVLGQVQMAQLDCGFQF